MDAPELAKKTEAELHAEAQAVLDRAKETETKIESTFTLLWREYRVEVIVIAVVAAVLTGIVAELIKHI